MPPPDDPVTGVAVPLPRSPPTPEAQRRLKRLGGLAWLLDRSIPIGKWRIGLDPILGLLPGAGDWVGAGISVYVLYEGARLGVPTAVLARMAGNILLDVIVGAVPILGDLFDFAWKANTRNFALIEQHYRPNQRPRSLRRVGLAVVTFAVIVLALLGTILVFVVNAMMELLGKLAGA